MMNFLPKILKKLAKRKKIYLITSEIKEREPLRKIQNYKKNKRMINLGNYTFESIVRDMTIG